MFQRGPVTRVCAAVVLAAFLPLATGGCFGKFQLTRNLYGFNQDVDSDKWIRWLAFLAMSIIPVYFATLFIDVVFANSVEFWTDDNPIDVRKRRFTDANTGQSVEMSLLPDGRIQAEISSADGGTRRRIYLEKGVDSVTAYDQQGNMLARVGENGAVILRAR